MSEKRKKNALLYHILIKKKNFKNLDSDDNLRRCRDVDPDDPHLS